MRLFFCVLALLVTCFGHADLTPYLKKISGEKTEKSSIEEIDFIYLINLDLRPEKLQRSLDQLKPYSINPHRFSAVYGAGLSVETINNIGVKFLPGMRGGDCAVSFSPKRNGALEIKLLADDCVGRTFFFRTMTPGAIGCTLSHLSVLQDAYDSGYQTIWIMEDDIAIKQDPHELSSLIKKLDALVGKDGWDILYTDSDAADKSMYNVQQDFEKDLTADLWFFSRPDMDLTNRSSFAKRTILSKDFIKIGSRMRTHSMIIRRSGMKKILDFEKEHHIFMPYDLELAVVPDIRLINLRYDLVTHGPAPSDTHVNRGLVSENQDLSVFENYLALYNLGLSQKEANKMDEALGNFFSAYKLRPTRAEPLFQSAQIYRKKGNFLLGYLLAKHALTHPYPQGDFNIDDLAYDHGILIEFANCALLLGKFDEGFVACSKLLVNPNLPREYRSRVQSNLELARGKLEVAQLEQLTQKMKYTVATPDSHIHERGYWIGTDIMHEHQYDNSLAMGLADFFKKEKAESVVDFGCGPGEYVKALRERQIPCEGYDGNPDSAKISEGIVKVADLSEPFNLGKSFDWVLSIEVGEHLPKKYEKTFVENLHRHNTKGIVLSWAVKGQGGYGHFNEQSNEYVKAMMAEYGYENDIEAEKSLRQRARLPWFKNTLMVFRKK